MREFAVQSARTSSPTDTTEKTVSIGAAKCLSGIGLAEAQSSRLILLPASRSSPIMIRTAYIRLSFFARFQIKTTLGRLLGYTVLLATPAPAAAIPPAPPTPA